ncbi:uncharacterized mitochondrial protein AtMg00810-like [Solanum tuberosum]|uniref:uncharacterized mitochondrial protein AtMg00810-like n=1 Tax=Solanum tuberosum TaxID=4113 RepID=UPI00073A1531|nr:PREDICTED: uncharacterized mitochondrial protein AtMg00810-like [Solanum tuberosum]
MGLLHYFLGLEVHQVEDGIFLSQRKYAKDLLSKFGLLNCKHAATPMNVGENCSLRMEQRWMMLDVSEAWFMQQPSKVHFGTVKRVLHDIAGTMDYGIWYSQVSNFRLCGFTDSDFSGSLDDRRSISAHVSTLGHLPSHLAKKDVSITSAKARKCNRDIL